MMPDLGDYAFEVLSAYAVSIALLVGLIWATLQRAARLRRQLAEVEARKARSDARTARKTEGSAQDHG